MNMLSILCVTRAEAYTPPFLAALASVAVLTQAELVLAADGAEAREALGASTIARVIEVHSRGFIESVLDDAVAACRGDYILRLDDDERISPAMLQWLLAGVYQESDLWRFPRVHLWSTAASVMMTPELFPDEQTRLGVKAKSGGRDYLHARSPWGRGTLAPVAIEHHKFLVKTYAERQAIAAKWHSGPMTAWSLPEDAYQDPVTLIGYGDGSVPWQPDWRREVRLRLKRSVHAG